MNVVIVGGFLPYPLTSGGRIRTSNLMLRLARRHKITYVGARNHDRSEATEALTFLGDHGIEAIEVGHAVAVKSGLPFYARLAANLASPRPYSVASFASAEMSRTVAKLAARGQVDLWQAEWSGAMASLGRLTGARTLVMAHNVETLIWERCAEAESNPLKRSYLNLQARKFARFERRAFTKADRVVTVSEADASRP
jgi:polysaccharide biosynthesis protein PslH